MSRKFLIIAAFITVPALAVGCMVYDEKPANTAPTPANPTAATPTPTTPTTATGAAPAATGATAPAGQGPKSFRKPKAAIPAVTDADAGAGDAATATPDAGTDGG